MTPPTDIRIAIIGLGYVGLPLAVEFGKKYPVTGFDIKQGRIDELKAGRDSTRETEPAELAEAKIIAAETAIKVTNDSLQLFGSSGYSREFAAERHVRDARMFTIAGGTAQILRTQVASAVLGAKLPQTRDGYVKHPIGK